MERMARRCHSHHRWVLHLRYGARVAEIQEVMKKPEYKLYILMWNDFHK